MACNQPLVGNVDPDAAAAFAVAEAFDTKARAAYALAPEGQDSTALYSERATVYQFLADEVE